MSKIITAIILSLSTIYGTINDPISIGAVSFTAAAWDNLYDIEYTNHRINNYTSYDKAVILYLFEACFT